MTMHSYYRVATKLAAVFTSLCPASRVDASSRLSIINYGCTLFSFSNRDDHAASLEIVLRLTP